MPVFHVSLTPAQKTALTTAYNNLTAFVDSTQGRQVLEILRTVTPEKRQQILDSYPRLAALMELGSKLRID